MIRYTLRCGEDHRFEGWFRNSEDFEAQAARGLIACPVCGDQRIGRAPMAPAIGGRHRQEASTTRQTEGEVRPLDEVPHPALRMAELRRRLRAFQKFVEANTEDVGDQFAKEARAIHAGEAPERAIRGDTTPKEADKLRDEGIEIASIPWLRTDDA